MVKPVASLSGLVLCLSLLVILVACSGRKLSTSAQGQALEPGVPKKAKVEPTPEPPKEAAPAPEPPPPPEEAIAPRACAASGCCHAGNRTIGAVRCVF